VQTSPLSEIIHGLLNSVTQRNDWSWYDLESWSGEQSCTKKWLKLTKLHRVTTEANMALNHGPWTKDTDYCLLNKVTPNYDWSWYGIDWFVFNATISNISAISWRPVLVVKKPEYPERTTDHGQATAKLYHLRLRVECTFYVIYKAGRKPMPYWW
jgi:hypothetical protein